MTTIYMWATDTLWQQNETETNSLLQLSFWIFVLADFSDWFNFFFSTSVWSFYFYSPSPHLARFLTFHLCAWVSVFTPFPSQLLSLCLFPSFLYLSQWELMWPLCAVSSLRGRQSSSAPIRTALSGAVSTIGLPTYSSIHIRHPPVQREKDRVGKCEWCWESTTKRKTKWKKVRRKLIWQTACCFSAAISFIHSLHLCSPRSSTVFTQSYLCLGP